MILMVQARIGLVGPVIVVGEARKVILRTWVAEVEEQVSSVGVRAQGVKVKVVTAERLVAFLGQA